MSTFSTPRTERDKVLYAIRRSLGQLEAKRSYFIGKPGHASLLYNEAMRTLELLLTEMTNGKRGPSDA